MDYEYCVSNIVDLINRCQGMICWIVSQSDASIQVLNQVLNEINHYEQIKKYFEEKIYHKQETPVFSNSLGCISSLKMLKFHILY